MSLIKTRYVKVSSNEARRLPLSIFVVKVKHGYIIRPNFNGEQREAIESFEAYETLET